MGHSSQRKLFKVGHTMPVYYQNKETAKADRDHRRGNGGFAVVMRGPDHWRGESFNKSHQMRGKGSN